MSKHLLIAISFASLAFGCTADTSQFRSAITGESCEPDLTSIQSAGDPPKKDKAYCGKSNNGHGNNEDGVDSSNPGQGGGGPNGEPDQSCDGTGDCIDDELHGHGGSDEECELPPGCDESLCCDPGAGDDGDDDGDDDGADDGSDDGADDGSDDGSDDGADDPSGDPSGDPAGDPPADGGGGPESSPSCELTCATSADCGSESVCADGCCLVALE